MAKVRYFLMFAILLILFSLFSTVDSFAFGKPDAGSGNWNTSLSGIRQQDLGDQPWISYVGEDGNVWLIHPDGSGNMQITRDALKYEIEYHSLNWSPDGKRLGFTQTIRDTEKSLIFIFDFFQEQPALLLTVDYTDGGFDWYKDSDHIVVDRPVIPIEGEETYFGGTCIIGYEENDGLYVFTLSKSTSEPLLDLAGQYPMKNPKVSPDGGMILFEFQSADYPRHVDQNLITIAQPADFTKIFDVQSDCAWKPDGTQIACGAWERNAGDEPTISQRPLSIFSTSGKLLSQAVSQPGEYDNSPLWSPAGDAIAFNVSDYPYSYADGPCFGGMMPPTSSRVEMISLQTSERTYLADGALSDWSPDGEKVLVSAERSEPVGESSFQIRYDITIVDVNSLEKTFLVHGKEAAWQQVAPPPPITDLSVHPGEVSEEIILSWTFIDLSSNVQIHDLEFRFSLTPLNANEWEKAENLYTLSLPKEGGLPKELVIRDPRITHHTIWYFAMKIRGNGGWSEISNVVRYIDTGFRVNINGYQFGNYFDINPDVTKEMVINMFPEDLDVICKPWTLFQDQTCDLREQAKKWMEDVTKQLARGRCLGMSATSLKYYMDKKAFSLKYRNVNQLYSTEITRTAEVRQDIARYQIVQWALPYMDRIDGFQNVTPFDVFNGLLLSMQGENKDPLILIVESIKDKTSHAVIPIALEEKENGWWKVWVYNSNDITFRDGKPLIYEIKGSTKLWRIRDLNDNLIDWGDETTKTLFTIPLSIILGDQRFPYYDKATYNDIFWIMGNQPWVLITDPVNETLGFIDEMIINTIPGARFISGINEIEGPSLPTFILPPDQIYTVILTGRSGSNNGNSSLSYFSQNSVIGMSGIHLEGNAQDKLTLDAANNYYAYNNQDPQQVTVTLAVDEENQSTLITLSDVSLPAGGQFNLSRDPATGILKFGMVGSGTYRLDVAYSSSQGDKTFQSEPIEIVSGAQHSFDLASWSQGKNLRLEIDEDADGTIDRKIKIASTNPSTDESSSGKYPLIGVFVLTAGVFLLTVGLFGLLYIRKAHL